MTTATTLRQAAAVLLAEADKIDGKVSSPTQMTTYAGRSVTIQEAWEAMLAEIAAGEKPHPYVAWGQGVLPDRAGTGDKPPASWDSHKIMWEAAQRGDPVTPGGPQILTNGLPGWPITGADGVVRPFRIFDYIPHGPDAIHKAIADLYVSPTAQAWLDSVGSTWPALRRQPTRW